MFGTQLSFLPRFYRLSLVSVLSNMMVPLAGLVDTAFLGHLADINQLAGVILGSILFDYLYRILKFLRSSTNALAAAAPDEESALTVLLRSGVVALVVGLVLVLVQYPLRVVGFHLLTNVPELQATGADYFDGRIWGAPAVLANFVLIGWFLGREQTSVVLAMSLLGNGINVVLDYWWIPLWGSGGAGLATAASQYGALGVGLVVALTTIGWHPQSLKSVFGAEAFRQTLALKANLLIRFFLLISVYAVFTNLSARLGTAYLALNGILLQIALLSQFTIQGVGLTTQTLVGNFHKEGEKAQILPLMKVSILTSTAIALAIALTTVAFPRLVFSLLTNHGDIQTGVLAYDWWLIPVLLLTALAFMLEGYFIGIRAGEVLRNSCITSFLLFLPIAVLGWLYQNNDLLWGALTVYMAGLALALGWRFLQIHTVTPTGSTV
ncbi:MAG TPA: MATE family efflux transporter [Cyanobacteria bacterium UBA8156]|nr:MATE family efflux transporter [Cyanobacteria bacterium UBA8156]